MRYQHMLWLVGGLLVVTALVGYRVAHASETHAETLARHGVTVGDAASHKQEFLAREEAARASKVPPPDRARGSGATLNEVGDATLARAKARIAQVQQQQQQQQQQPENAAAQPVVFKAMHDAPSVDPMKIPQQWRGLDVPSTGIWDFHGLKVDMTKSAVAKIQDEAFRVDYDWKNVHAREVPPAYAYGEKPAFTYPDDLDPLFVTLSHTPRILYFPEIVTPEEAEYVLNYSAPRLEQSGLAYDKDDIKHHRKLEDVRTSRSTWVPFDGPLHNLDKRLSAVVGLHDHEPMNVLLYGPQQHYDAHHDYFDPARYGKQYSNRMGTFFLYLNDTEAGGSTSVPRANNGKFPANYKEASCQQGLQIFPRKGSAFLLYDMRPDKTFDEFSLHGGCDVEKGTKWGGVVWFRVNTP